MEQFGKALRSYVKTVLDSISVRSFKDWEKPDVAESILKNGKKVS